MNPLPDVSPMPKQTTSQAEHQTILTDYSTLQQNRDKYHQEQLTRSQEIALVRDKLVWCYKRSGVNHQQECRLLSEQYLGLIGAMKGVWFKGYRSKDQESQ